MDDTDLIVQALDKTQGDFILRLAISGDPLPVVFYHLGELFIGPQPLPFECIAPVLKEFPGPGLAGVVPELTEGFLQNIGRIEALVRRE